MIVVDSPIPEEPLMPDLVSFSWPPTLDKGIVPEFLYFVFLDLKERHGSQSIGAVFRNLNTDQIKKFMIPLPPLETQKKIVARIEEEQQLVAANKKLIQIYEAKIKEKINEVWGEGAAG
jgi:type I restriction enzyme M protein